MPPEPSLKEYESLRQEVLQSLQRVWQVRVAAISSSAILLGLVSHADGGFGGPVAWFVPPLLFILCNSAAAEIAASRSLITRVSVYIELRMEEYPNFRSALGWERTCSRLYSHLRDATVWDALWHLFIRDPLPWLSLLELALSLVVTSHLAERYSLVWAVPYLVVHIGLFVFLVRQLYTTRWVDRDAMRLTISKVLQETGLLQRSESSP